MFALVDDDFELSGNKFVSSQCGKKFYAARNKRIDGKNKREFLHRIIMEAGIGDIVDHKNRDTLDNRKENLRICTQSQNCANSAKKLSSNKYKGVTFHKRLNKFSVRLMVNYKNLYFGLFRNEIDAAKKYDEVAKKYFGEFARTNF